MHLRSPSSAQAVLSACAAIAAIAYGAPWLGLRWVYEVSVNGNAFQLGPGFPLGILAAVLMGAAATVAKMHGRTMGATGLSLGGGALFASSLWLLLVWAPGGANPGQLALLQDASRLGFMLLALALPLALPLSTLPLARLAATGLGLVLAPVLLFPEHVEQAGLADARTTVPMVLFFLQAGLALSGAGQGVGKGWGRGWRKPRREPEPELAILRAVVGRARRPSKPRKVRHEALRANVPPDGPQGPQGPERPHQQAKRPSWFFQF